MTIVLAFLLMLIIVAAMAIGVMLGRKPIAGSCGGMKALGMDMQCEICGGNPKACEQRSRPGSRDPESLGRDATRTL
ncbi:MAG: (Na+)-NQR maturation NqrM [Pseudomonadales bacterium]